MILGAKSALFAKKCTFCTFTTLNAQKSCESIDQTKGWRGHHIIGELFAKKCTFGALGAHWVPELAGWLAGAEARAEAEEARAEAEEARAEARARDETRARAEARASAEAMVRAATEVLLWCLPVPPSCFVIKAQRSV